MLKRRIEGKSIDEIAKEFNSHPVTVYRRLSLAKNEGLLDEAVDRVLESLLSKSLDAYDATLLQEEDPKLRLEAARDIAYGTGVLSKGNKARVDPEVGKGDMTLRAWREKKFATTTTTESGTEAPDIAKTVSETRVLELTRRIPSGVVAEDFEDDGETDVSPSTRVTTIGSVGERT
jgi:hypothetical protein